MLLLTLLLLFPVRVQAHSGAPLAILIDEPLGPYTVSLWADPDIGTGTFIIEALVDDQLPAPETTVVIQVRPLDGHTTLSDGMVYAASERREVRGRERFTILVPFDTGDFWEITLTLEGPDGIGTTDFTVEVTPPGPQWLEFLLCLLPFGIIAAFWLYSTRRAIAK